MATKTTKPQTFILDIDLGPRIQLLLAKQRVGGGTQKYASISDFVNQATKALLAKEEKK